MTNDKRPTAKELLHGTLDTLVLKTLSGGRRHGYAIARAIEDTTEGVVEIEDGSLYPALYRLERKGWVDAEWGLSDLGRRAKFYRLTPKGRRQLAVQTAEWTLFAAAITRVLLTTRFRSGLTVERHSTASGGVRASPRKSTRSWRSTSRCGRGAHRENGMHPAAARREAERRLGDAGRIRATLRALGTGRNRQMQRTQYFGELARTSRSPGASSARTPASRPSPC